MIKIGETVVAPSSVDRLTGRVTFATTPASTPTASFEFDVPVRYDTDIVGVDLESEPDHASDPALSVRLACSYWEKRQCNISADQDFLLGVTRKINGGVNGIEDRRLRLNRLATIW